MELLFTDEQALLQESFRKVFAHHCSPEFVRRSQASAAADVLDPLWSALAEMGVFGLAIPEEHGGIGGSLFDLGLVFAEAGRALCPTKVYSTTVFAQALLRLGSDEQRQAFLPAIAAGSASGSVALWNPSDAADVRPRLEAVHTDAGWKLSGTLMFVPNADLVDYVLVSARTADSEEEPTRTLCFVVETSQPGWHAERLQTFGRDNQCEVRLDGVVVDPARALHAASGVSRDHLQWISDMALALQTMEMAGGAEAVIERTVGYVKERQQFDRPLASFQAVQHHVADMHIALEGARLAAFQAIWWVAKGGLAEREVAIAKLKCSEAYKQITLTAHQLHGGMGYMREFDLHLWSERAKTTELLGGAAAVQLRRLEHLLQLRD
ncbi:acyl-CoA dehydrogenase family protein [Rhodanobacter lindaniclasticus]